MSDPVEPTVRIPDDIRYIHPNEITNEPATLAALGYQRIAHVQNANIWTHPAAPDNYQLVIRRTGRGRYQADFTIRTLDGHTIYQDSAQLRSEFLEILRHVDALFSDPDALDVFTSMQNLGSTAPQ